MLPRHFLSISDLQGDLDAVLVSAAKLKKDFRAGRGRPAFKGKTLGMIFEKSSTRTRVSFEAGMTKLGGHAIFLGAKDIQLGRGESIEDTALVLSRYVDLLVYRAFRHENVVELARHATVPVVNGLSDLEHPCQILADWLTIRERKKTLKGLQFVYVGDGNNMANSYLLGAALAGMHARVVTPPGYEPDASIVERAERVAAKTRARIEVHNDFSKAFDGADVVATDTWVSMGDEEEKEQRLKDFAGFTVTDAEMKKADDEAIFLHCLPAYYGYEVEKEVAHGPRSAVFDEAENRMWAQMALLVMLDKGQRKRKR
ncbi:MAG: ornithine carbamoyltransferase [Methanobacteriota archaeon]